MMKMLAFLSALALASPAIAHDQWSNGGKVPAWIKQSCCGAADAHHLRPEQVHDYGDWYEIDGYFANGGKISRAKVLPSQDGEYWAFWADYPAQAGMMGNQPASQSTVYCFFVPMAF
jgi:hypothetical protein